jgi:hypothetical protein
MELDPCFEESPKQNKAEDISPRTVYVDFPLHAK